MYNSRRTSTLDYSVFNIRTKIENDYYFLLSIPVLRAAICPLVGQLFYLIVPVFPHSLDHHFLWTLPLRLASTEKRQMAHKVTCTHTHTHTHAHTHARTHAPTPTHARTHTHTSRFDEVIELFGLGGTRSRSDDKLLSLEIRYAHQ